MNINSNICVVIYLEKNNSRHCSFIHFYYVIVFESTLIFKKFEYIAVIFPVNFFFFFF